MGGIEVETGRALGTREGLIASIAELNESAAVATVRRRLDGGEDPLTVMEDCRRGMGRVGEYYERGRYFISGLIMAGEIFGQVMELLQPLVEARLQHNCSGRVLLGTVQGDIHDLGKNITGMLLGCYGFTVIDLGVDVPPEEVAFRAREENSDIIGLSCLLTGAYESMSGTIRLLRHPSSGLAPIPPIIIGGSMLDEQVARYVGADYWVTSAMGGVDLCRKLIADR